MKEKKPKKRKVVQKFKCSGEDHIVYEQKVESFNRSNLYYANLDSRDWNQILKANDAPDLDRLNLLYNDMIATVSTNQPALKELENLRKRIPDYNVPIMMCEFGFGHTTYQFLKWCYENNAYLVTVDLPIVHKELTKDKDHYSVIHYHGADRYHTKYNHALKLTKEPSLQNRWLWINDDIFKVTDQIVSDLNYRNKLFLNGTIDYFYEDAIHDDAFLLDLYTRIKPFMSSHGIFTGDDNCPTFLL